MAAKRKTSAAGEDDTLLPDIWREILSRLPVKSILRCRSVCKSWYSLVSCPDFISDYSARTLGKNDNRVLLQLYDNRYSFRSLDASFMESRGHDDVPKTFLGAGIVGSCNGLICLCKYDNTWREYDSARGPRISFLIWNPTIRKIVELPCRNYTQYHPTYFGFGFDSKTNDHKVLCSVGANGSEIFDLKKGLWRSISPMMHSCHVWRFYPDCYVNGAVHWIGFKQRHSNLIILSFNMSDECFREIRMPDREYYDNDTSFRSVTFDGLIYVMVWNDHVKSCSVWVMKEYGVTESWTKLYNIDLYNAQVKLDPDYFRLWDNGEFLMVHNHPVHNHYHNGQNLVLYNTRSRESKHIFSANGPIVDLHLYKESLFLMCGNG